MKAKPRTLILATLTAFAAVLGSTGVASAASTNRVEAGKVTGAPALIIILVILALIVIGIVAVIRFVIRKGRDVV